MENYIFLSALVVIAVLNFLYIIKRKIRCPKCSSSDLKPTGQKQYEEISNIFYGGSPKSNYKFEFCCSQCGNKFWRRNQLISTN